MRYLVFGLLLCGLLTFNANVSAQISALNVLGNKYDTNGNLMNAHGAGVMYHNGKYYLYGEIKKGTTWQVPNQSWEDYRVPAGGISCYSSTDLKNWKYEGVALAPVKGQPESDIDTGRVIERPKVIYNSKTRQFVMWMHVDKKDYSYSQAGVATSNTPAGPFHYIGSVQPNGQMARDMTLFKDDDGKAYLIYSSEQNNTMQVCLLSDDYLTTTKTYSRILINRRREAPAMFKNAGKYYLISSDCTGWAPNSATYAVADNIMGPYTEHGNPCTGPGAAITYQAQSTYVVPLKQKDSYLFLADRWNKIDLEKSDYIWLPLTVNKGKVEVKNTANAQNIYAQSNLSFENGLTGWQTTGSVVYAKSNCRSGSGCVKIGNGAVMQRIPVGSLKVVMYNAYLKSSDTTVKGYSVIRFYNAKHQLLLAYKSGAIKSIVYQQSGNYTETPFGTSYMEIGVEKDSIGEGAIYADDFSVETNIGDAKEKHQPMVNLDQYMRRFWQSDTIYNETVLMYSVNGGVAEGRLLYTPDKILSVKKFDLSTAFQKGIDYTLNDNIITKMQNSTMPFRADTSFDEKKDLAWYNLQSQWVVVTYTHHDKWDEPIPAYKGDKVPGIIAKLKAKKPVRIAAFGMSITRGMDVSSYDTVPPYMPTYVDLFARQLRKKYGYQNIKMYNAGLPGSVVSWGAEYADQYISAIKPDLVILDFGMNDFWRYTPEQFSGYIQTIMRKIKAANPEVEFLLLSNMKFDPDYVLDSDKYKAFYQGNLASYSQVLKAMEAIGIINLDMTTLSDAIYRRKKAKDCIVNPLHPNDYMARWYAQGLAALLIR